MTTRTEQTDDNSSNDSPSKRPRPELSPLYNPEVLPNELKNVDFTQRITWGKYAPYTEEVLPLKALDAPATPKHRLEMHIHNLSNRARAGTIHLQRPSSRPIPTPMFMPVGTKGCLKGVTIDELMHCLDCPIILGNTYHLAIQPGTELIREQGQLRKFQGNGNHNLLTDSGGFQMVSLSKLSNISEEGVTFENPFAKGETMLLKPEDSIRHQTNIGADIIMALDDVVSSVIADHDRFREATYRTLRWYDRCLQAKAEGDPDHQQNLFPIVQGGLDTQLGGLREQCLAGFRNRDQDVAGFAIGGLAGGESKDDFWRVVNQCCKALPDDRPRYLMGVGYPLDLVVCTALGVDMYDCVYPTRTARFGVALINDGTCKLKAQACATDFRVIQENCKCQACQLGITRSRLHFMYKTGNPVAVQLLTQHNLTYMMQLVGDMRNAILENRYPTYARAFVKNMFAEEAVPGWVVDALNEAGISLQE
ncbi:queuine tRNA-ribosyltransferase [Fistulifera solaris]|uniref:tRNA-guanosine(34) queuine transglycosylase n=1 Tax=Fistulifera solaris TaxID=1519565 RepID=A0A1Z5JNR7_FISSO|nr:queuine tRNA-ribosyltransferase [Fistulifera solaris]|eukprot:GAX15619.1 queuine tRNA-ribosyltransferase [Fistulifera solaris]